MTNYNKPTVKSRVAIPPSNKRIWSKPSRKLSEVKGLKVMQSVAYPVKDQKEVKRYAACLQTYKNDNNDYVYRTLREGKKVVFRVWRTV